MSRYLTQLIRRHTRPETNGIRPRLPSRFEPPAELSGMPSTVIESEPFAPAAPLDSEAPYLDEPTPQHPSFATSPPLRSILTTVVDAPTIQRQAIAPAPPQSGTIPPSAQVQSILNPPLPAPATPAAPATNSLTSKSPAIPTAPETNSSISELSESLGTSESTELTGAAVELPSVSSQTALQAASPVPTAQASAPTPPAAPPPASSAAAAIATETVIASIAPAPLSPLAEISQGDKSDAGQFSDSLIPVTTEPVATPPLNRFVPTAWQAAPAPLPRLTIPEEFRPDTFNDELPPQSVPLRLTHDGVTIADQAIAFLETPAAAAIAPIATPPVSPRSALPEPQSSENTTPGTVIVRPIIKSVPESRLSERGESTVPRSPTPLVASTTVQVSIGRIEVRATPSTPATPVPQKVTPARSLSLEQYLHSASAQGGTR
jgi:hypothetical protein